MREHASIARSSTWMLLSTVTVATISFLCIAICEQFLQPAETARFLAVWPLCNTVVLALILPLEQTTPTLLTKSVPSSELHFVGSISALFVGCVVLIAFSAIKHDFTLIFEGTFLLLGFSVWYPKRAQCLGHGKFDSLAKASLALLMFFLIATSVPALMGFLSLWILVISTGVGFFLFGSLAIPGSGRVFGSFHKPHNLRLIVKYWEPLVHSYFASLVIANGPLLLAPFWGVGVSTTITYAITINLVRLPLLVFNTALSPLNLRIAHLYSDDKVEELRGLVIRTVGLMVACVLLLATTAPYLVSALLKNFFNLEIVFARQMIMLFVLTEGVGWFCSLGRILAISLDLGRQTRRLALSSIAVLVLCPYVIQAGANLLWIAPLFANLTLMLLLLIVWIRLRH